jgi:hypothetical protein
VGDDLWNPAVTILGIVDPHDRLRSVGRRMTDPIEPLVQQVAERVIELVANALDINALAARVDLNILIARVNLGAVLKKVDVNALLAHLDMNRLLEGRRECLA